MSIIVVVLQHTGCLCDAVIALLKVPLSFQRYFFQKLQSTSIKVVTHLIFTLIRKTQKSNIPIYNDIVYYYQCMIFLFIGEVNAVNFWSYSYSFYLSMSSWPSRLPHGHRMKRSQCRAASSWLWRWRGWCSTVQRQDSSGRSSPSVSMSRPSCRARRELTSRYRALFFPFGYGAGGERNKFSCALSTVVWNVFVLLHFWHTFLA